MNVSIADSLTIERTVQAVSLHVGVQVASARQCYAWALQLQPDCAELLFAAAVAALEAADVPHAEDRLRELSQVAPSHEGANWLRNWLQGPQSRSSNASRVFEPLRLRAAFACCERVLAVDPRNADAHFLQGLAYCQAKGHRQAIESFDKALALRPGFVEAMANKGLALSLLVFAERVGEDVWRGAVRCFDRALELNPGLAMAYRTRSIMLAGLSEMDAALRDAERAWAMEPSNSEWRADLGIFLLRSGDWARGWGEYEHRRLGLKDLAMASGFPGAPWTGEPLKGKSIVLHAEQGLGDSINFFRFVRSVQQMKDVTVHVWLPPNLQPLLMPEAFTEKSQLPRVDYRCSFMSLGFVLGVQPESVPDADGYVRADPTRVARWRERLGPPGRLRVGLAWSGNPGHTTDVHRSLTLTDLLPLLEGGLDVEFVCLQKEVREADKALLDSRSLLSFHGGDIADFSDTAALCELMDVVISVDTSVAHLAGAMGKTVWILLSSNSDWRWLMDRDDTPWYQSARLFRQEKLFDWQPLVTRVRDELEQFCDSP